MHPKDALFLLPFIAACGGGTDIGESQSTHPEIDAAASDGPASENSDDQVPDEAPRATVDASVSDRATESAASADADETCDPPPQFPPVEPCARPGFNAVADSYTIWVADAGAAGGGWRIDLPLRATKMVGGHTYANTGAGLTGSGTNGVYGDASFDVDGQVNALGFHFEGCLVATGEETWDAELAVTKTTSLCSGCQPATIGRRYTIVHAGLGRGTYTFTADDPPRGCGTGVDLLSVVLPG
jgi:hypothetical protein